MAEIKWHSKRVIKKVKAVIRPRMRKAMLLVQGETQKKINVGQSPVVRTKGGNLRGTKAEKAPVPPRVLTSRLKTSITHNVSDEGDDIVGRVGTNVPYAARLEFGFSGTDSKGRNVNAKARPYLRPSLDENLTRVAQILVTGN